MQVYHNPNDNRSWLYLPWHLQSERRYRWHGSTWLDIVVGHIHCSLIRFSMSYQCLSFSAFHVVSNTIQSHADFSLLFYHFLLTAQHGERKSPEQKQDKNHHADTSPSRCKSKRRTACCNEKPQTVKWWMISYPQPPQPPSYAFTDNFLHVWDGKLHIIRGFRFSTEKWISFFLLYVDLNPSKTCIFTLWNK